MNDKNKVDSVLLVLVGALGDLAWRKFLKEAKALEESQSNPGLQLGLLLVDVPWQERDNLRALSEREELRLRIGRRLIELRAEELSLRAEEIDPEKLPVRLEKRLGMTPLPWEVESFVETCLAGEPEDLMAEKQELTKQLNTGLDWFQGISNASGFTRYTSNPGSLKGQIEDLQKQGWKVVVFVATPPEYYPLIIDQWRPLADRLVLEKPASGLNPKTLEYPGTQSLREAVNGAHADARQEAQITTSDHYNAKLITLAIEHIREYHLFDYVLEPRRIKQIVVELLEPSPLPLGRYNFYNGAGGAFGDMAPHLLQAVRAILHLTTERLDLTFQGFCWGRDQDVETFDPPQGYPYDYDPDYFQQLNAETETFAAFKAEVKVDGRSIPLYCRTGKNFVPAQKTLRVDINYKDDDQDAELSLIFNFGEANITIKDQSRDFELTTGKLAVKREFESGIPSVAAEYKGIFECLLKSEPWQPTTLDARYFPPVKDASNLVDLVFSKQVEARKQRQQEGSKPKPYKKKDNKTYRPILEVWADEAKWNFPRV
ncbi:MAG: hypothetical protein L0338_39770 [Acidobacteria bacterium]|nr:hypothetical protein [Acidobacteriota bacterium]